jgi:Carbohydrate binding module (family 6)/Fibronectin type III domain
MKNYKLNFVSRHIFEILTVTLFVLSANQFVFAAASPVTWINPVNITVTGNNIAKNGGCSGCADSGAVSQQQLTSGNGYVEFTATTGSGGYIGLGNTTTNSTSNLEINFGLSFGSGAWSVRELNFTYRTDGTYAVGDVFRIAVQGTQVIYTKNGAVIYTSTVTPTYPLVVDTSLLDLVNKIDGSTVDFGQAQPVPTPPALISSRCSTYTAPVVPAPLRTFYINASAGNDLNDGLTPATAWQTIQKANNNAIPGDLFLMRGTFTNQWINPVNSGTPTNKISFKKESGQTAIIETGLYDGAVIMSGQSHIVVDGFEIRNVSAPITLSAGANNIWLRNLYVHNSGQTLLRVSNNNRIEDSVFTDIGNPQTNEGDSVILLPGEGTDTAGNDNNVVVRNYFGNAGHAAYDDTVQGSSAGSNDNNIVAQNIFNNQWATNVIIGGRSNATLVECNEIKNASQNTPNPALIYPRPGVQLSGDNSIIRYNRIFNNKAYGMIIQGYTFVTTQEQFPENNQFYQNTVVSNGSAGLFIAIGDSGYPTAHAYVRNNTFENNIFWSNGGYDGANGNFYDIVADCYAANFPWAAGFTDGNIFRYNNASNLPFFAVIRNAAGGGNLFYDTPALAQTTHPTWTNNIRLNPLFTNSATNDYSLLSTSPMINVGRLIPGVVYNGSAPDLGAIETTVATQSPYPGPGVPNVPLTIEAENYDIGGETISYHDTDAGNNGGVYRTNDVDIQARAGANNGYEVFNAAAGEWLEYTINVPATGLRDIGVRYASLFNNGKFHVEIDGVDVTGQFTANSTGSWSTYQTLTKPLVNLTAGNHVMRLVFDTNSPDGCACVVADFDSISITASTAPTAPSGLAANVLSTTSVKLDWVDNSNNESSFIVQRCSGSTTCTTFATVAGGTLAVNTITFTNTGLTNGTIYRYRIGAVNAVNTTYSTTIATITVGIPAAPTALTATAVAGKKANLSWTSAANNVTNFQVQRCAGTTAVCTATSTNWVNASLTVPGTTLTYQDPGLTAGTAYRYRVRAVNGAGNSAYRLTTATITALP